MSIKKLIVFATVCVFPVLLRAQQGKRVVNDTISLKPVSGTFIRVRPPVAVAPVPQDLYTQHLGFFCRQELKMQQAHVPLTFRLGSMEYCNYLEQKPGYR